MSATLLSAGASGALVGFMLGLVGGGGSILATPLLLYVVGVANPHVAIGTGALAVSANALVNFAGHALKGHVWWRCAFVFACIGTAGALAGSSLGKAMDGHHLLALFALLMMAVGALMLRQGTSATAASQRRVDWRMCLLTALIALLAGTASGFFGIGGGFLIVPALIFVTRMPMISAIGSSLLAVGSFGIATAINYSRSGLVDWPLALEFIGGGVFGGLLGMALASRLSTSKQVLNRIFAALIFIVAFYMLWESLVRTA